jgi:hypothetical protein
VSTGLTVARVHQPVFAVRQVEDSMKCSKRLLGILTLTAGLVTQANMCSGASWEGTDDFSGGMDKWNTTYIHPGQPSDGLYVNGGHLEFIKTATTTSYEGSGALLSIAQ